MVIFWATVVLLLVLLLCAFTLKANVDSFSSALEPVAVRVGVRSVARLVGNLVFIIILLKSLNTLSWQLLDYFWLRSLEPAVGAHASSQRLRCCKFAGRKRNMRKKKCCARHTHTQKIRQSTTKAGGKLLERRFKKRRHFYFSRGAAAKYFALTFLSWPKSFIDQKPKS